MRKNSRSETAIFVAHDDYTGRDTAEPEKNLMRAVLRSVMEDVRKKGEPYREARRYLLSEEDYYLYSFLSICQHLELCPRTVRAVLGITPNDLERAAA